MNGECFATKHPSLNVEDKVKAPSPNFAFITVLMYILKNAILLPLLREAVQTVRHPPRCPCPLSQSHTTPTKFRNLEIWYHNINTLILRMVVPYFLHLPRSHNETRDRFTSITCYISLFYFLKPDENCSAMQVLEDMHKCLDNPELSYVDDTMGLFIMLPRAMGSSSKATHKLSKATTSWRPGKLLPATPLLLVIVVVFCLLYK